MLRAEDNKFLTESGAGTPMGELLRRFWLPVLLSKELPVHSYAPSSMPGENIFGQSFIPVTDTNC